MAKIKLILIVVMSIVLSNCSTGNDKFPIDKRYWDTMDYANVTRELKYGYKPDEKLPSFNNPETRIIVEKYTDHQNFNVVLEDKELGLKHKNGVAQDFFTRWKDMVTVYRAIDRQDNYIYDQELMEVEIFGLDLQLKYFKLGNDVMLENADDPNSTRVRNAVNSNINTLISNYNLFLDEINDEDSFSEKGKELMAEGIDVYFAKLIELNPRANYSAMETKIDLMYKKSTSEKIKKALTNIKTLIESKKVQEKTLLIK